MEGVDFLRSHPHSPSLTPEPHVDLSAPPTVKPSTLCVKRMTFKALGSQIVIFCA